MLVIKLFGPCRITHDSQPLTFQTHRSQILLAYLAMHPDQPQHRERLAELLWADGPGSENRTNLRTTLSRLNKALEPVPFPVLDAQRDTITFVAPPDSVDALRFREWYEGWQRCSEPLESCAACVARLEQAVALYDGLLLDDLRLPDNPLFEAWMTEERSWYESRLEEILAALVALYEQVQQPEAVIRHASRWAALVPWEEQAHLALMRAYLLNGQRHAALQQYETLVEKLAEELDVEPGEEAVQFYKQLRANQIAPPAATLVNPYRGLKSFSAEHSAYFFGREDGIERVMQMVAQEPLVVLVGASGSGKSSLLHAGVIPAVQSQADGPTLLTLRPGNAPFLALAEAILPHASVQLPVGEMAERLQTGQSSLTELLNEGSYLLLIDQFEELFSLSPDLTMQDHFLERLLEVIGGKGAGPDLTVLVSIRANFLRWLLAHGDFASAMQGRLMVLGAMSREALTEVIVRPAQAQQVYFEPGLTKRLLDDVGHGSGRLPLLQFTLTRLWQEQDHGWITHAAYDALGGVTGALNQYANSVLEELGEDQQRAQRTLLRLVQVLPDAEQVRRLGLFSEFSPTEQEIIQQLVDARLLVTNRHPQGVDSVELVHEALLHDWEQLRTWLEEDHTFRLWQGRVRLQAQQWETQQDEGLLLRGVPLLEAEQYLTHRREDLGRPIEAFIEASRTLRQQQETEQEVLRQRELQQARQIAEAERRRAEAEHRTGQRLRVVGVVLASLLLLLLGVTRYAFSQEEQALRQAQLAEARHLSTQAIRFSPTQPDLAALLSLEALNYLDNPVEQVNLFSNFQLDPRLDRYLLHSDQVYFGVAHAPDGRYLILGNDAGDAFRLELGAGDEPPTVVPLVREGPGGVALSRGGERFSLSQENRLTFFDAATFEEIARWEGNDSLRGQVFSGDGRRFVVHDEERYVLFDVQRGSVIKEFSVPGDYVLMAMNQDGSLIALMRENIKIDLIDVETEKRVGKSLTGHEDGIHGVVFSPDGSLLATTSFDGTVRLWDTQRGTAVGDPLHAHNSRVLAVAWHPSGQMLASSGTDNRIFLWDVESGKTLAAPLIGHNNWPRALSFHPDGKSLISVDDNGVVIHWRLEQGMALTGHEGRVREVSLSPDGRTLVTSSFDTTLRVWDAQSLDHQRTIATPHKGSIIRALYSPDGQLLATGDTEGVVVVWDSATWQPLGGPRALHETVVIGMAWTLDSTALFSGDFAGQIIWHDARQGTIYHQWEAFDKEWTLSITLSPDGTRLATGSTEGTILLYEVAELARAAEAEEAPSPLVPAVEAHTTWVTELLFTPDSKSLLSASGDGTIRIWDSTTGEAQGAPLEGHVHQVWDLLFHPLDPEILLSLDNQGNLFSWTWAERTLARPILQTGTESESMALSPDGQHLYLGTFAPTAQVWQLPTQGWRDGACQLAQRNLTLDEWELILPTTPYHATCPEWPLDTPSVEEGES